MLASSHGTLPHCELLHQNPRLQTDPPQNQRHADPRIYRESACLFLRVYLKSRKFSLFLQTQLDFALKSLEIHKGFLRLFALNPACVCEIFVIFFVFRYTLTQRGAQDPAKRPELYQALKGLYSSGLLFLLSHSPSVSSFTSLVRVAT